MQNSEEKEDVSVKVWEKAANGQDAWPHGQQRELLRFRSA